MEQLFQYEIPVWHPVVVHFPPALLVASLGAAIVWFVRGTRHWRRFLLFLLSLSLLGTLLAYFTGDAMHAQSEGVPMVELFVEQHETVALYTLWVTVAALGVVGGFTIWLERARRAREPFAGRLAALIVTLAATLLVAYTAHIGGVMVWGVPV